MFKVDDKVVVRGKDHLGRVWNGNHKIIRAFHPNGAVVFTTGESVPAKLCKLLERKEEEQFELVPAVLEELKVGDKVWVKGEDKDHYIHKGYESVIEEVDTGFKDYPVNIIRDDGQNWYVNIEVLFIKKPVNSLRPITAKECQFGTKVIINGKFRCNTIAEGMVTRTYTMFQTELISQALVQENAAYAAIFHKDEYLMVPLSCIFVGGVPKKQEEPKVDLSLADEGLEELRDMFSKVGKSFSAKEFNYGGIHEGQVLIERDSRAVYAVVDAKGEVYFGGTRVCHYSLENSRCIKEDLVYVVNMVCTGNAGYSELQPEQEKFLHWLYGSSPWKDAFITKDPKEAYERGCVLTADVPANYLLGALMAGRFVGEHQENLLSWNILVEEGCDPSIAFVMSYGLFTSKGSDTIKVDRGYQSHGVFYSNDVDLFYLKNFMKNNQTNPLPNFSKHKGYSKVSSLYKSEKRTETVYNLVNQAVKPFVKETCKKAGFNSMKVKGLPRESVKDFLVSFTNLVIKEI